MIYSLALINCGVFRFGYIDYSYAYKGNISMILLNTPQTLKAFDRNPRKYGQITYIA